MSTTDSFTGEGGVSIITENDMAKVENYLKQSQAEFKLQGYLISNPHFKWGSNFNPSGVFLWFRQRRDFAVPFLLVAS